MRKGLGSAEVVTIRQASTGWLHLNLGEIWQYRELLELLVWRNTIVRYKQTVIGIGWALVRPVVSMVIFSVIFGRLARLPSDGIPYPVFTYVALLPWTYFAGCLSGTSGSLVGGAHLLSKVYFPRLILPLSQLFSGLIDFLISFVVLAGMMLWYRGAIAVTWVGVLCLPVFLALAMLTALAFGLWFTSFSVKYRDVQHIIPFVVQVWMYLTPVAYSASLIPERFRLLYGLNPMVGVIDGFRWALLGRTAPHWGGLALGMLITVLVLAGGLRFFRRTERTLVDIL